RHDDRERSHLDPVVVTEDRAVGQLDVLRADGEPRRPLEHHAALEDPPGLHGATRYLSNFLRSRARPMPGFVGSVSIPSFGCGSGSVNSSARGLVMNIHSSLASCGTAAARWSDASWARPQENPVCGAYFTLCAWTSAPSRFAAVKPPMRATSGWTMSMARRLSSSRNPKIPNSDSPAAIGMGCDRRMSSYPSMSSG